MSRSKASEVIRALKSRGGLTPLDPPPEPPPTNGPLDNMLARNARTVIAPDLASELVTMASGLGDGFEEKLLVTERLPLSGAEIIAHPAFVKEAASRGVSFFVGQDGMVNKVLAMRPARPALPKKNGKADPDFYLKPAWYADLKAFVDEGATVLLIGPAGSGKSRAVKEIFKERGQLLRVVSCTPRLNANDLEGDFDLIVENGKQATKFSPTNPVLASQHGDGLLFDEVDAAPAEAMYSVYRLLDGEEMHIVRKGKDAIVQRHPELRIVGTQNTEGRGDDRGLYHGRSHQDEAFLDRWEVTIRVTYPEPDDEVTILCGRTGISEVQAKRIVAAANAFRASLREGDEIMFTCTLRRTLAVARNLARGHTPRRAWEFAVLNRAIPEDAAKMPETLNRIYGTKW